MADPRNLNAALALADAGLPIFPVRVSHNRRSNSWDKRPLIAEWQRKATTDQATIRSFWRDFPDAVPGVALGRAGLVVVDADRHGGPDGVEAFHALVAQNGLPAGAVRSLTPGSGEHWIFRNLDDDPLDNREGALPDGINMRGRGGFIVAPGAVRSDGRCWAEPEDGPKLISSFQEGTILQIPDWLVRIIRRPPDDAASRPEGNRGLSDRHPATSREATYAARALEDECARLAGCQRGARNETLNKAAYLLGTMAGAGWIDPNLVRSGLLAAAGACGYIQEHGTAPAQRTITSGLEAGMAKPRPPLQDRGFGTNGTIGTGTETRWDAPDPAYRGSGRSDPPSFPTDLLGPFWGDWCQEHAKTRHVPVDYVATALLASASALIGNARWPSATPEWQEPPVLWCALVGSPSAGKSPAMDPVLKIVHQIEEEAIAANKPAQQAHKEALELAKVKATEWQRQIQEAVRKGAAPPPRPADAHEPDPIPVPRLIVGDTTPERLGTLLKDNPKGLLLNRDEISGWIGSFGRYSSDGGGERAMWLEAYGGRPYTIDRQKQSEPTAIRHLSIAVLGSIQPDKLHLVTGGADDGFAARILWSWPDPVVAFQLVQTPVPREDHLAALKRLHSLALAQGADGIMGPAYLPLSNAAAIHFEQYVGQVKQTAWDVSGPLAGTLGKAPGHVLRLAIILEYLTWSEAPSHAEPTGIGETAMLCAIGLVDGYYIPMARRVFGEAAIPEDDRFALELARWIIRAAPIQFNARETRRKIGGALREAKHMTRACEVLMEAGWIKPIIKSRSSGGRSASDYEVNPLLFKQARTCQN